MPSVDSEIEQRHEDSKALKTLPDLHINNLSLVDLRHLNTDDVVLESELPERHLVQELGGRDRVRADERCPEDVILLLLSQSVCPCCCMLLFDVVSNRLQHLKSEGKEETSGYLDHEGVFTVVAHLEQHNCGDGE